MHNHPSTGIFSGADLKYFCNHDTLYIITAIGNNGIIYSLIKTSKFDIKILAEYERLALEFHKKGYKNNLSLLAVVLFFAVCGCGKAAEGFNVDDSISTGYFHTVGLKSDGIVVSAGGDRENFDHGQCNVGDWRK